MAATVIEARAIVDRCAVALRCAVVVVPVFCSERYSPCTPVPAYKPNAFEERFVSPVFTCTEHSVKKLLKSLTLALAVILTLRLSVGCPLAAGDVPVTIELLPPRALGEVRVDADYV